MLSGTDVRRIARLTSCKRGGGHGKENDGQHRGDNAGSRVIKGNIGHIQLQWSEHVVNRQRRSRHGKKKKGGGREVRRQNLPTLP
jgi:hypothetical protein